MSDLNWPGGAVHPPLSLLLLHLEGELDGENAKNVSAHVTHCWECRTRCQHLSQGIFQYMEFETAEPLPPPPSNRERFRGRLLQVARETPGPRARPNYISRAYSGMLSALRPRWRIVASAVVLALVSVVFLTISSRNIAAGEVLNHAVIASKALSVNAPGRVIYQKILVRHGNVSFERTLSRGVGLKDTASAVLNPDAQVMNIAGINWSDPLSASDFSEWRSSLHSKSDQVSQSDAEITVDTLTGDAGPLHDASLTVQRSDWHPIRRHVEFRQGAPLDITEVSFEVRTVPAAAPIERSRLNPAPASALPNPSDSKSGLPPSDEQLEEAELRLREVFHSLSVDILDSPVIWREGDRILFHTYTDDAGHKDEVLRAVATIPFIAEAPLDARAPLGNNPDASVQQLTMPFTTVPPLADALTASIGGLDNANRYLASLRQNYGQLLAESAALQRLGQRYTPEIIARLGPGTAARISALAGDEFAQLNREVSSYRQKLLPLLADMLRSERLSPGSLPQSPTGTCRSWRDAAAAVAGDAKALNSNFLALFVQRQVERPTELDAERLLRDSEQSAEALRRDISAVCNLP